jgi:hypothetical protein
MNTKQDDKKPLKVFMLGGGYRVNTPYQSYGYPKNRLSNFLNFKFDPENEEAFFEFCTTHQIIFLAPSFDQTVDLFLKEQQKFRILAKKLTFNELSERDLNFINRQLGKIKMVVRYPAREDRSFNSPDSFKKQFKDHHLIIAKRYPDNIVTLWEELVRRFIEKQDIQECANCGNYFTRNRRERKFCENLQCKNTYNKRKNRLMKKAQA